jgi:hypothetical protein
MAPILKTPEISMKFDLKSQILSKIQRMDLNSIIFGCEVCQGGYSSRKLALILGSDEPLSYGRM